MVEHRLACDQMIAILRKASIKSKLTEDDLMDIEYFNRKLLRSLGVTTPSKLSLIERLVSSLRCK